MQSGMLGLVSTRLFDPGTLGNSKSQHKHSESKHPYGCDLFCAFIS